MPIVLCKGGGFEPPYEYIPSGQLPEDENDVAPPEPLPKERKWFYPGGGQITRYFEDIAPVGFRDIDLTTDVQPISDYELTGEFTKVSTWVCGRLVTLFIGCDESPFYSWRYTAFAAACYDVERTENREVYNSFTYTLDEDPDSGNWDYYTYENSQIFGGTKPGRSLSYDPDFKRVTQGGGVNIEKSGS